MKKMRSTPINLLEMGKNRIFIKREDLIPVSFGGNKARKAYNFFKEIDEGSFDYVVTYGSSSSNHCRIIANMSASRNLPCLIISPEEESEKTFNSLLMELFGAEIKVVPVEAVSKTIDTALEDLRKQGRKPYFIAGGGHGNCGTQAYVDCFNEILSYERENALCFDYIFHASGTGTTQAGLVCGKLINKSGAKIVGISIARQRPRGRQVVIDSVAEYLSDGGYNFTQNEIDEAVIFEDLYICGGYAKKSEDVDKVINKMMCQYGIPVDSTYVGKAYWGMLQYLEKENIQNKNILFIHTGGTPLFFDDLNRICNKDE